AGSARRPAEHVLCRQRRRREEDGRRHLRRLRLGPGRRGRDRRVAPPRAALHPLGAARRPVGEVEPRVQAPAHVSAFDPAPALADRIWAQPASGRPEQEAAAFVSVEKEVADAASALAGARDICAERIAEHAGVRKLTRAAFADEGVIRVTKVKAYADKPTKFD